MKNRELVFKNFLTTLNILSAFVFFITQSQWLWILAGVQIIILIYFFKSDFSSFLQSMFWPLFLISLLLLPWPASFIIPIAVYLSVIYLSDKTKKETSWLKFGTVKKTTIYLMIPTILVSSAALILWVFLLKPDLTDLKKMVPANSIPVIVIVGLLFSVFNSIWEEIILKGILWNGMEKIVSSILIINLFQAVLFGVMHLNGFPRGIIGAVLAGIYGLLIGFIRKNSGGLLAPIVTHFFADATIFGILVAIQ